MANVRLGKQAGGMLFALGIQALFALLLLYSLSPSAPRHLARETLLLLHPAIRAQPPIIIDARRKPMPPRAAAPPTIKPPPDAAPGIAAPPAPSNAILQSLGQSLYGCAPQNMGSLSAEARARCGRTGIAPPPRDADLLQMPSDHVQDRSTWDEHWAEDHFTYGPCPGSNNIAVGVRPDIAASPVTECMLNQYRQENHRAAAARQAIDDAKAAAARTPSLVPSTVRGK